MKSFCRIFFKDPKTLRSFYWFEYTDDHSIYFGSSNNRTFRTGYAGTSHVEIDGTHVDPIRNGRSLSQDEICGKTSIHGSGIVNLSTTSGKLRDRYTIVAPRSGFKALPLVGILPMDPMRYPVSKKTPKATDLVLEANRYSSLPLGLLVYLNGTHDADPLPILGVKSRSDAFSIESVPFGGHLLCVSIYAHAPSLRQWQHLEVNVLAHPQVPGEEPNWPFFA